jgi:tryptophan-rich sensory protein
MHPIKKNTINIPVLLAWIILCELAGVVGSVVTIPAIPTWYTLLIKPSFSPPNWIFGPVWTTLYLLMGVAAYRIGRIGTKRIKTDLVVFVVQLLLNAAWSFIFFGLHNIPAAFAEIAVLWITIILLVVRFERHDKVAALLLVPYLLWVSFAMTLNYNLWLLNPY